MNRTPSEIGTGRIGPLARLPAFFALENKRAVVAGSGRAAAWKAELLSAAGARVAVFAPAPGDGTDCRSPPLRRAARSLSTNALDDRRFCRRRHRRRRLR